MRPLVHLTAETGWINDPHGVTWHGGEYHLFHQYVPGSPTWAPGCQWGHAVSPDLVHWEHREVALAPGEGDDGIWTGCLVEDGTAEGARILYTSVVEPDLGLGRVREARPLDARWDTWRKGEVLVEPPTDLDLVAFRDPTVLREGTGWRMLVGGGTRDGEALALTWTSPDLTTWAYDGVAARRSTRDREQTWTGSLWECPQLLEVDGRWVMVTSVWEEDHLHYAAYGVGTLVAGRFTAESWGRLGFGESYYAPSCFRDAAGRPCLIAWMRGVQDVEAGWAGALSAPYVLSLAGDTLVATPHPGLDGLRVDLAGPVDLGGRAVLATWRPAPGERLVLADATGAEVASLAVLDDHLVLARSGEEPWTVPWSGGAAEVLVDGPVLEVATAQGLLGGPVAPAAVVRRDPVGTEHPCE